MEAVKRGAAVVGVRTKDSVILAVERRTTAKLQDSRSVKKLLPLDENITLAFAGLNADARVLIDKARMQCQSYRLSQEVAPSVEIIARYIAEVQQKYTQRGGRRPFGIATFLAGFGEDGTPQLWQTDPSGTYTSWKANATGRSMKALREFLEKHYKEDSSTEEGVKLAVMTLMEVGLFLRRSPECKYCAYAPPGFHSTACGGIERLILRACFLMLALGVVAVCRLWSLGQKISKLQC